MLRKPGCCFAITRAFYFAVLISVFYDYEFIASDGYIMRPLKNLAIFIIPKKPIIFRSRGVMQVSEYQVIDR